MLPIYNICEYTFVNKEQKRDAEIIENVMSLISSSSLLGESDTLMIFFLD